MCWKKKMIHLCLLASGNSKRFGSNKLLRDFQGRPLWTYGYDVLRAAAQAAASAAPGAAPAPREGDGTPSSAANSAAFAAPGTSPAEDQEAAPGTTPAEDQGAAPAGARPTALLHVVSRYGEIIGAVGAAAVIPTDSEKGLSYTIRSACEICEAASRASRAASLDAATHLSHAENPGAASRGEVFPAGDRILFLAADQPYVNICTVRRLMEIHLSKSWDDGLPLAACTFDGKKTGNPVIFSGLLMDKLKSLEGDQGGKALFAQFPDRIARVECDPQELIDIDVPD